MIRSHRKPPRRRGAVLMMTLVAVALASVLLTSLMTNALSERRQVRKQRQAVQADWLVEAGLQRAVAQLASDAGYRGETWRVDAKSLGGQHAAVVHIEVSALKQPANARRVVVQADLPEDPPQRVRRQAQFTVQVPSIPGDAS